MANLAPTPKVAAAAVAGIIASTILANVDLITPELFDGLGKWSHLVYGLVITLAMSGAGWLKSEGDNSGADDAARADLAQRTEAIAQKIKDLQGTPIITAPATVFPKAAVDAAVAAAEPASPVEVTPVFEAPITPPAPVA